MKSALKFWLSLSFFQFVGVRHLIDFEAEDFLTREDVHAGLQAINQPINPSINQYDASLENQSNLKEEEKNQDDFPLAAAVVLCDGKNLRIYLVRFFFALSQFEKRKRGVRWGGRNLRWDIGETENTSLKLLFPTGL